MTHDTATILALAAAMQAGCLLLIYVVMRGDRR